jgi:membrane-bound lytic murein transglycosylase D
MMFKKHVLVCSGLFLLTLIVTILLGKQNTNPAPVQVVQTKTMPGDTIRIVVNKKSALNFADERLPEGDAKVRYRMQKALARHDYESLQTTRLHDKAAEWFPVIEPILERYGIPEDFKYITLVESGLKEGVSRKGAAGYWQFMPGTARSYGLKVNRSVDERKNMRKSTIAACKYIRELYAELQSWTLVAAAYNIGDTRLKAQMARQKQANYYKMRLNRETATYLYKLISMKEIIENPADHGYERKLAANTATPKPFSYRAGGEQYLYDFRQLQN